MSRMFTRYGREITMAVKEGGPSPDYNTRLRAIIQNAKSDNMPKDNIDRAIKKGTGGGDGAASYEEITYEGYGPGGAAVIVDVMTDNKNRTVANLKHILAKHGGRLVAEGSVKWMFATKGQIILEQTSLNDAEELAIIEAGAEDIIKDEEIKIITPLDKLEEVKNSLLAKNFKVSSSEMVYLAKEKINLKDSDRMIELLDALDDDDDVNNIFTNANI